MLQLKTHNYTDYFDKYLKLVPEIHLIDALEYSFHQLETLVITISEEKGNYAYAPEKWTIKELLIHLIDTERIFCYRALTIARNDKSDIPGFDENFYVKESNAGSRTLSSILNEYKAVRTSTINLFQNFSDEMLNRSGKANNNSMTVLSIGYFISGHELHHLSILNSLYLV